MAKNSQFEPSRRLGTERLSANITLNRKGTAFNEQVNYAVSGVTLTPFRLCVPSSSARPGRYSFPTAQALLYNTFSLGPNKLAGLGQAGRASLSLW